MQTSIKYLTAACACAVLMACAGGGQPVRPAPLAMPAADAAAADNSAADGYYVLGRNQYAAGRRAEALQSYQQALRIAPAHINARNGLAVLYAGQGDYRRAIELWRGLTDAQIATPEHAFLFSNLGYAYFLSGDDEQALNTLEKACVLDPLNAATWEHLGAVLEKTGHGERAALMFRQALSLRQYDARADYALARQAAPRSLPAHASTTSNTAASAAASAWPDDMARTEVTLSGGIASLRRVAAPQAGVAPDLAPAPQVADQQSLEGLLRLEIRNGNGVTGMAAALARTVAGRHLQVVRLSNEKTFLVARTRVGYRADQQEAARALAARLGPLVETGDAVCKVADLCVVIGLDLTDPAALHRYYVGQLALARVALARLG
ncbi:tetratricopeptide repeat protein [Janthinobacterium agaricidamnosum]|uniref:Tetratricopeptide repeat family protein n=1 Tax=Janthinobacterium agaricidamnosum NBRC 102515 = DSM 9628 TaxID=1349767 RepID=W0VE51_9BURK|nr:tetratricopeptide repeat protein [Janthinobacterium agaricidamnosum]CDG85693.1 tetratricopeptide repeat family protein [Janthinobacterium agaricidamnosum NBRC 102515 = DSM 9628]